MSAWSGTAGADATRLAVARRIGTRSRRIGSTRHRVSRVLIQRGPRAVGRRYCRHPRPRRSMAPRCGADLAWSTSAWTSRLPAGCYGCSRRSAAGGDNRVGTLDQRGWLQSAMLLGTQILVLRAVLAAQARRAEHPVTTPDTPRCTSHPVSPARHHREASVEPAAVGRECLRETEPLDPAQDSVGVGHRVVEAIRRIALALPEVTESWSHGEPCFLVRGSPRCATSTTTIAVMAAPRCGAPLNRAYTRS